MSKEISETTYIQNLKLTTSLMLGVYAFNRTMRSIMGEVGYMPSAGETLYNCLENELNQKKINLDKVMLIVETIISLK